MKLLLYFFILITSVPVFSQGNVIAKKNGVVWENVFISTDSNIAEYLAKHPRLKVESSSSELLKGKGTGFRNSCSGVSQQMLNEIFFDFEIQIEKDKYRVTVSHIQFGLKPAITAESLLMHNGTINYSAQSKRDMLCLEDFFNRLFTKGQIFKNKS